jgi:hypothetical protein
MLLRVGLPTQHEDQTQLPVAQLMRQLAPQKLRQIQPLVI